MILRGTIEAVAGRLMKVVSWANEPIPNVLRLEPSGMSSGGGSDCIILMVNGDPSRSVAIKFAADEPTAPDGALWLFDPESQAFKIKLSANGIEIEGDPDKITIGGKRIAKVGDKTSDGASIV